MGAGGSAKRRSSSITSSASAPFCGPNRRGACASSCADVTEDECRRRQLVERLEQARAAVHRRRAAEADEQPRARPHARDQLAEAAAGGRAVRRAGPGRAVPAPALSTTGVPSSSAPHRRSRSAAERVVHPLAATRLAPNSSAVPSPPSASGNSSTSAPASRSPPRQRGRRLAAERTPLRLAGDASARTGVVVESRFRFGLALVGRLRLVSAPASAAASRRRGPRARGTSARGRRRPTPRSPGARTRTRTRAPRGRRRSRAAMRSRPGEADVPGPEREDRRDVHQQRARARRPASLVNVEGPHRDVDGQELEQPAAALEERGHRGGPGRMEDAEAVPGHLSSRRTGPRPSSRTRDAGCALANANANRPNADRPERENARRRPVRDLGRLQHVEDQHRPWARGRRAGGRRRSPQRRPDARAAACRRTPGQHRHAGELADPARQDGVRQEADRERGEVGRNAGIGRLHRLRDDARQAIARAMTERRSARSPPRSIPLHRVEGVPDHVPVRPAPPEHADARAPRAAMPTIRPRHRRSRDARVHARSLRRSPSKPSRDRVPRVSLERDRRAPRRAARAAARPRAAPRRRRPAPRGRPAERAGRSRPS